MEWKTISTLLFSDRDKDCVWVCEHLCVWTCFKRERGHEGKGGKRLRAGGAQEQTILFLEGCAPALWRLLRPVLSPSLLSRTSLCLYRSLLILPKHIVLLALHVLKVKVAAGHTFVDVLNVVAGGLEVSGGIIGPRGEDLGKMGWQDWGSTAVC